MGRASGKYISIILRYLTISIINRTIQINPNQFIRICLRQVVVVPNAYYVPLMNEMRFPAAFLQGIYYNSQRPQYLNFGGIGSLVGHEMTHGFDRQGRNFDHKGRCIKEMFYS